MIVFLDFDGVLITRRANLLPIPDTRVDKTARNVDKGAVEALNYLLNKLDDPKIVVSSTWRLSGIKSMKKYLADCGIKTEVIDITPICKMTRKRDLEINTWIENNKYDGDYIVIDDENYDLFNIPPDKFIHVERGWDNAGLTKEMVDNYFQWRQK